VLSLLSTLNYKYINKQIALPTTNPHSHDMSSDDISLDQFLSDLMNEDNGLDSESKTVYSDSGASPKSASPTRTDNANIFSGDMPITSYPVIDTVLDNMLTPECMRMKYFPTSTTQQLDIYTDSKTLVEELESRLSGITFKLNSKMEPRNTTKFVNDQLAM